MKTNLIPLKEFDFNKALEERLREMKSFPDFHVYYLIKPNGNICEPFEDYTIDHFVNHIVYDDQVYVLILHYVKKNS